MKKVKPEELADTWKDLKHLHKVKIISNKTISHANGDNLEARCIYTNEATEIACKTLILVTERQPNNTLYQQLIAQEANLEGSTTGRYIEVIE